MMDYRRFFLFLYGTGNILGCLLGLAGLGLFFSGLIKSYWIAIVVGLYLLGFLLAPANQRLDLKIDAELDLDAIIEALDNLVKTVRKKASADIVKRVQSIKQSIVSILSLAAERQGTPYNIHIIQQTAFDYLPDMLETYLALPPAFARLHPVKDGKTANEILLEQLDLLDTEMRHLAEDIFKDDTQALLAHGAFLKEKFARGGKEWLG